MGRAPADNRRRSDCTAGQDARLSPHLKHIPRGVTCIFFLSNCSVLLCFTSFPIFEQHFFTHCMGSYSGWCCCQKGPWGGSDNCSSDGKGPGIAITHYSFIGKSRGLLIAASSDPAFQNVENQQRPQISLPQDEFGSAEVCLNTKLCSHASNACTTQCSQSLLGNCTC